MSQADLLARLGKVRQVGASGDERRAQLQGVFRPIRPRQITGTTILLVEQKLSIAMKISNRVYIMGHGRVVFEGTPEQLKSNAAIREEWLEV